MVQIDKGIPLPRRDNGREVRWPFRQMEPGDSFFAPGYVMTKAQRKNGEKIMALSNAKPLFPGSKWAMRLATENGVRGVRVWRMT